MVQIIQRPKSFGEKLGAGLGNAAESLAPYAQMHFEQQMQQKTKLADIKQKQDFAQQIMNDPSLQGLDPTMKRLLAYEAAGLTSAQGTKSAINALREGNLNDFLTRLQSGEPGEGGEPTTPTSVAPTGQESTTKPPTKREKSASDYEPQIDYWRQVANTAPSKEAREIANKRIEDIRKQQDFAFRREEAGAKHQFQKGQMEYQEAKPTIEHANDLALSLPNQLQDLEGMEQALKSKDFGFFSTDNLAELTGVEGFRSKEGALLKSSIKNYFLGDVKGVGGKGLNQWLEKQLSDAMLKIGRDNSANETVLSGFRAKYDRDQMWLDEYRKLYKKQKEDQGYVNGDIGQEVAEKVKPYYEARQKQLEAEIKAIQAAGKGLSGRMVDVTDPNGDVWEIDESQVGDLPEGWRLQ